MKWPTTSRAPGWYHPQRDLWFYLPEASLDAVKRLLRIQCDGKESACNAGDLDLISGSGEGNGYPLQCSWASLVTQMVKNPPAIWDCMFDPWVGKIPWRREWQPIFFPGESPWTEEPVGCSPWGR